MALNTHHLTNKKNKQKTISLSLFSLSFLTAYPLYAAEIDCRSLSLWNNTQIFVGGDQAQHNNAAYKANWWTQGNNPGQYSNAYQEWSLLGQCANEQQPPIAPNNLIVSSISDTGAAFSWEDHIEDTQYSMILRSQDNSTPARAWSGSAPNEYIGGLQASTAYQLEVKACQGNACSKPQSMTFTTTTAQLGFTDALIPINELSGDLHGQITFAQTHTTSSNKAKNADVRRPDLVIERDALLMFTPVNNIPEQQYDVHRVAVEIYQQGVLIERLDMSPPSALPLSDQPDNGRQKVIYSRTAWSIPLSWKYMKPGLSLRFIDGQGRYGELPTQQIGFSGAPELVIQNIDLGFLTQPRDKNLVLKELAVLAADYFQKIPVSRLIMADYTMGYFPKVTLPNGKVYTERSDVDGGVYDGDMRGDIGKALVSIGINNANFGITDTAGNSQYYDRYFNHITAHTSIGIYQNGTVIHGLSGGGGIVTLYDTIGNEWSHELGHNYGLGHYPNKASVQSQFTGWGYDARYQRFIGNLNWSSAPISNTAGNETIEPFANQFTYLRDTMAGGMAQGLISRYTLHHQATARQTQQWLNASLKLDKNSPSGYARWNDEQQTYQAAETDRPVPLEIGVPVITVLGIYDPLNTNPSQIYPLLYSNYGNLFRQPAPNVATAYPEGWISYQDLTPEQKTANIWQTLPVAGNEYLLCKFDYASPSGTRMDFVGYVDPATQQCTGGSDIYFADSNGQRHTISSEVNAFSLRSKFGDEQITYTPQIGSDEKTLCYLNLDGFYGAGYIENSQCRQVEGVKWKNRKNWSFRVNNSTVTTYSTQSQRQCMLVVNTQDGQEQRIALHNTRYLQNQSNKFHLNLPADNHPTEIKVLCDDGQSQTVLDTLQTPVNPQASQLSGPAIIGQQEAYNAVLSQLPSGWFSHPNDFNPLNISALDKAFLAQIPVFGESFPVCRFTFTDEDQTRILHGYVETINDQQYRCTGGQNITYQTQKGEKVHFQSEINQFEWLSLNNPQSIGHKVTALDNDDRALCYINQANFYGAGFMNEQGQCVQTPEVYWSNGNRWIFSGKYQQYTFR
ncbi:MAG: M66 family metalloprotease [Plesiomonas sp.]|uniref:M66 family metalloprotease n=1 Tax=Plesiomonas sp. TaxID=2486279 RepID=UPI003F3F3350